MRSDYSIGDKLYIRTEINRYGDVQLLTVSSINYSKQGKGINRLYFKEIDGFIWECDMKNPRTSDFNYGDTVLCLRNMGDIKEGEILIIDRIVTSVQSKATNTIHFFGKNHSTWEDSKYIKKCN